MWTSLSIIPVSIYIVYIHATGEKHKAKPQPTSHISCVSLLSAPSICPMSVSSNKYASTRGVNQMLVLAVIITATNSMWFTPIMKLKVSKNVVKEKNDN